MKNRNSLFFLIIIFVALSILIFNKVNKIKTGENITPSDASDSHRIDTFDAKTFYNSINIAADKKITGNKKIAAAVVPHYFPAGYLIARLFESVSGQNIKRVIVIGPNHEEKGAYKVTSSNKNWATNFGLLHTDSQFIKKLESEGLVNSDDSVLEGEQSIEVLATYIKYYLPQANIVPLVLKKAVTEKESEKLADFLAENTGSETILLASVDFSHYLPVKEADENDKHTLELLKNYDYAEILNHDSAFIDSPGSVVTLLKFSRKKNLSQPEGIEHVNSASLGEGSFEVSTGFYLLVFRPLK